MRLMAMRPSPEQVACGDYCGRQQDQVKWAGAFQYRSNPPRFQVCKGLTWCQGDQVRHHNGGGFA